MNNKEELYINLAVLINQELFEKKIIEYQLYNLVATDLLKKLK